MTWGHAMTKANHSVREIGQRTDDSRLPTGITGFDTLTRGGLPAGRTTLVVGGAGCGKTLFALQTLVEGARRWSEPGIFVAFEQRPQDIVADAASFGWDLPRLQRSKLFFLDAQLATTTVQAGAFDLAGLLAGLAHKAREMGARRIVFDGIDMLLTQLEDPAAERRELYRLHQWLQDSGLTGILTAKSEDSDPTLLHRYGFLQFLADCVVLLDHRLAGTVATRHLRIVKYRGGNASCNDVPLVLSARGVAVVSYDRETLDYEASSQRLTTGVAQLDTMLSGGFFRGSCVLVSGAPGTAKSTLAGAFAEAACRRGEPTLYVSFDQGSAEITRNLASVGIRLSAYLRSGRLRMHSVHARSRACEAHLSELRALAEEHGTRCLVIDPLSALNAAGEGDPRGRFERLILWAKERGITLLGTTLLSDDGREESTPIDVSTIADTWLHLTYSIQGGERSRSLSIVKARGIGHSNQVRELSLSRDGPTLTEVYVAGGAVLMGTMRWEREQQESASRARERRQAEDHQRHAEASVAELRSRIDVLKVELDTKVEELKRIRHQQSSDSDTRAATSSGLRRLRRADPVPSHPTAARPRPGKRP